MKPSDIVRERGWVQYTGNGPNGEVCMGRAICLAAHGDVGCRTDGPCGAIWAPFTAATGGSVTVWNDAPGRTMEQVIALLQEFETDFDTTAPEISAPVVAVPV